MQAAGEACCLRFWLQLMRLWVVHFADVVRRSILTRAEQLQAQLERCRTERAAGEREAAEALHAATSSFEGRVQQGEAALQVGYI